MIKIKNLAIVIFVMILSVLLAFASFGAGNSGSLPFSKNNNFNNVVVVTSIISVLLQ